MSKAIMLSIKPQYVAEILNGDKILEIRTTCPKEWKNYLSGKTLYKPEPMKVYIYCTKTKKTGNAWTDGDILGFDSYRKIRFCNYCQNEDIMNGRVVAEFTLKEVEKIKMPTNLSKEFMNKCCLDGFQIMEYLGGDFYKDFYAWHIDDLKIYDKPKELSEFTHCICPEMPYCPSCSQGGESISESEAEAYYMDGCCETEWYCCNWMKKAPKSWCYIEENRRKE